MSLLDFDFLVLKFFNHLFPFSYVFLFLTEAVYIFLFFFAYLFYKKERKKFYHFALSFLLGFAFIMFLKYLINRPRPFVAFPNEFKTISFEQTPSFPSTHSFMAFFLIYFVSKNFKTRKKFLILLYLLLIPFFLLHIGAHYPTDLIAGAIIGYLFPTFVSEKFSLAIIKKLSFQKRVNK